MRGVWGAPSFLCKCVSDEFVDDYAGSGIEFDRKIKFGAREVGKMSRNEDGKNRWNVPPQLRRDCRVDF